MKQGRHQGSTHMKSSYFPTAIQRKGKLFRLSTVQLLEKESDFGGWERCRRRTEIPEMMGEMLGGEKDIRDGRYLRAQAVPENGKSVGTLGEIAVRR